MPWVHLDIPLSIALETPLHVGSGHGAGLIRKALVKFPDEAGPGRRYLPYIPGSALKGRVRNLCEDLGRRLELRVCGVPRVAEADENSGHLGKRCIVCRIFGSIGGNSPEGRGLTWHNAYPALVERDVAGQTVVRAHVQLSRARGAASAERLFTAELAAPGLRFEGRVAGWLPATESPPGSDRCYEVAMLLAAIGLVDSLGGMRRRGAGRCRILLPETISVTVGGREVRSSLGGLVEPLDHLRDFDRQGDARGA